jgi:hypothetical protein
MSSPKKTNLKNANLEVITEKLREFELALYLSGNLTKSDLKKLKLMIENNILKPLQQA